MSASTATRIWVEATLAEVVMRASRRITDEGLRARVQADEGRRITAERDRQVRADRLTALLMRPWRDLWGRPHCARCAGLLDAWPGYPEPMCSCPRAVEEAAA